MKEFAAASLNAPVEGAGPLDRLAERWRLWRERRRMLAELRAVAAQGLLTDTLLQDIGVTQAELDELIDSPLDAGQQFETLAAIEGVDLQAIPPQELRDAHWACIRCECREPCTEWLGTGVWNQDGDTRCPNSELLNRHSTRR